MATMMKTEDLVRVRQRSTSGPISHRVIEKRRRDRMNKNLAELGRLIPQSYMKKQGQGRVEKTEVIELAIRYIRALVKSDSSQKSGADACCLRRFYDGYKCCADATFHYLAVDMGRPSEDPMVLALREHLILNSREHIRNLELDIKPSVNRLGGFQMVAAAAEPQGSSSSWTEGSAQQAEAPPSTEAPAPAPVSERRSTWHAVGSDSGFDQDMTNSQPLIEAPANSDEGTRHYKFKHMIKQRFSDQSGKLDGTRQDDSDGSRCGRSTVSSDSTQYPQSDESNGNGSSSGDYNEKRDQISPKRDQISPKEEMEDTRLPGFVLHSSGSHYIPVVFSAALLSPVLPSLTEQSSNLGGLVYHPINIPVMFGGPQLTLSGVSERSSVKNANKSGV